VFVNAGPNDRRWSVGGFDAGKGRGGQKHYFCAPDGQINGIAGAVTNFLREEVWVRIVLVISSAGPLQVPTMMPYNLPPINSNYEIKPWLDGQFRILVPEHLEAELVVASIIAITGISVRI
jgi:hypothetical protein